MIIEKNPLYQKIGVYSLLTGALLVSIFFSQRSLAEKVDHRAYSAGQWKNSGQIYRSLCIYCHQTGIAPTILGRHYSPQALKILVRSGINTMPTFRVTEINNKELEDLATWVEQSAAPSTTESVFLPKGVK